MSNCSSSRTKHYRPHVCPPRLLQDNSNSTRLVLGLHQVWMEMENLSRMAGPLSKFEWNVGGDNSNNVEGSRYGRNARANPCYTDHQTVIHEN